MKTINKHADKERYWRAQMAAADRFPGSQQEFCKSQGLSLNTFQYWRKKFNRSRESHQTQARKPSPFAEVEVIRPIHPPQRLPDAKWVAELVWHLHGGGR
jgi:hypothetical protein